MDLYDQLRTYVRIVETGSLSAAARDRRLSLAAVSRQLSALEADLGASLVVRTTRKLQITPGGRRWYAHCVRLLRELEDARADVAERGAVRGELRISAPVTLGLAIVVPRLERLARAHPHLEIELRLEDHVVDLVGDAVDLAVRGGIAPPDSASVIAHPLARFHRVVVAAPAYLKRHGTPRHPRELVRHAGLVQTGAPHWRLARGDEVHEVTPRAHLRSTAPVALRDWAAAGAGLALLPEWLVTAPLRRVLPGWQSPPIAFWAIHRVELRGAPRIRAAIEALAS